MRTPGFPVLHPPLFGTKHTGTAEAGELAVKDSVTDLADTELGACLHPLLAECCVINTSTCPVLCSICHQQRDHPKALYLCWLCHEKIVAPGAADGVLFRTFYLSLPVLL